MAGEFPVQQLDVRQRGFRDLTPVSVVLTLIRQLPSLTKSEQIPIQDACERISAEAIHAPLNVPSYRRAAMDGFAVAESPIHSAEIVGLAKANQPYCGDLQAGQAVRIMTGSPVPDQATTVYPIEVCEVNGAMVRFQQQLPHGKNIIRFGEDVQQGQIIIPANHRLRPADLGLLASLGMCSVSVLKRPTVRVIITGSEVLPVGQQPSGFQIVDSNSIMLNAMISRDGGEPSAPIYLPDDPTQLHAQFSQLPDDLILVVGGTSVGTDDHAPNVLRQRAVQMIHGIHMKPGMPTAVGLLPDQRVVMLLPGNPVACFFAYELLVRELIQHLTRQPQRWPYRRVDVPLSVEIQPQKGRVDFLPAILTQESATLLPGGGAASLSRITRANGFIIIHENGDRSIFAMD